MNSFDLMIEKYRKELIDAKRKSIVKAIEEEDVFKEDEARPILSNNTKNEVKEAEISHPETVIQIQPEQIEVTEVYPETEETAAPEEQIHNDELKNETNEAKKEIEIETLTKNNSADENMPNTSFGNLRVQVFAADRVYPISAAYVTVTENNNPDNVFFQGYTDISGIIDDIRLPTPSKEMSEAPTVQRPYARYDIIAEHPRFIKRIYSGAPVFAGVKTIQNVQLVPTNNNNVTEVVTESEPNDLLLRKEADTNA